MCMDLNDGMQIWPIDDDRVVNINNPKGEGYAGECIHALAHLADMSAVNQQHEPLQPTFFPPAGGNQTLIDYIFIPTASLPTVGACQTLRQAGARLQLINDKLPRDHRPLLIRFEIAFNVQHQQATKRVRWDFDKLADALSDNTNTHKTTFVNQVNDKIQQYTKESHAHDLLDQNPSQRWDRLIEDVATIGKPIFGAKNKPFHSDEYREMAAQRDQLLTLQRAIRQQAQCESTLGPDSHAHDIPTTDEIATQLLDVRNKIKRCRKKMTNETLHRQTNDLQDAWDTRDFAPMWRAVHTITRRFTGPRHRKYNILATTRPSAKEWLAHVSQPATKGGMGAENIPNDVEFTPVWFLLAESSNRQLTRLLFWR